MIARTSFAVALSIGLTSSGWSAPRGASLRHAEEVRCYEAARKPCGGKEPDRSAACLKEAVGKCLEQDTADHQR